MIDLLLVLAQTITPTPAACTAFSPCLTTAPQLFATAGANGFFGAANYIPDLPHFTAPITPLLNIDANVLIARMFGQAVYQGDAVFQIAGTALNWILTVTIALILIKGFMMIFSRLVGANVFDPINDATYMASTRINNVIDPLLPRGLSSHYDKDRAAVIRNRGKDTNRGTDKNRINPGSSSR